VQTCALPIYLLVIGTLELAAAALDRAVDVIFRHALRLRLVNRKPQAGIGCNVAAAHACGDGDFTDQAGEELAPLLVLCALPVLNVRPFAVSGHIPPYVTVVTL